MQNKKFLFRNLNGCWGVAGHCGRPYLYVDGVPPVPPPPLEAVIVISRSSHIPIIIGDQSSASIQIWRAVMGAIIEGCTKEGLFIVLRIKTHHTVIP